MLISSGAGADEYHYVDWQSADVAQGTAYGVITLPDSSTVGVTFAAINPGGGAGNLAGAQTSGGTNFWVPSDPYLSPEVENAPPDPDILQLSGGTDQIYRVTLSEPIRDPIMAVVSLGQPAVTTTYAFDAPFTIVSQGAGYWGGGPNALVELPDNVLQGNEGHGTIRFIGTFSTFSWTVPTPEFWHGFTFGIRTTERIEPTDAGVVDADGVDAGEDDADEVDAAEVDASEQTDANEQADAGGAEDAAPTSDADAPSAPDAETPMRDASAPRADASAPSDAAAPKEEDDGCSCEATRGHEPLNALVWLALAFSLMIYARRQRI